MCSIYDRHNEHIATTITPRRRPTRADSITSERAKPHFRRFDFRKCLSSRGSGKAEDQRSGPSTDRRRRPGKVGEAKRRKSCEWLRGAEASADHEPGSKSQVGGHCQGKVEEGKSCWKIGSVSNRSELRTEAHQRVHGSKLVAGPDLAVAVT